MERLVTTAQAAQILGLSLQGVHYRIKKNQLKSIKKSGKTYVYINDKIETNTQTEVEVKEVTTETLREVIKAKDEQVVILKKSIKWMKKQHNSEILRLEKNQKRIIGVFNREIELLQSAFNEMRSVYKPQIQNQKVQDEFVQEKEKFIAIQDFTLYLKKHNKSNKKLLILNEDFSDLI